MHLVEEIRNAIQSKGGTKGYVKFVESLVKKDANGKRQMEPEEFSFKAIWEAFYQEAGCREEAVDSTAFAKATGALINAKVIDGYQSIDAIGDKLVTVIPSKLKMETIVGFNALDTPEEVSEGMPYPASSMGEKYVTVNNTKWGRIIDITEETIMFDQTGQILVRSYGLGEKAALKKEQIIIEGATEITSNVYKPSGAGTTLYTGSSLSASSPLGTVGIQNVENKLREMTDENSNPVVIPLPWILLLPSELYPEGRKLYTSERDPDNAENADNIFRNLYNPVTSPFLTSSTQWWMGNFKREFVWTQVYGLETLSRPTGTDADFERDIRYQHKVRFYGGIGAVDNKYVVKATA